MSAVLLERLARNAAVGLRFIDVATGATTIDGLQVEVYPRQNRAARRAAHPNRSGIYVAHALPGLRDFEFRDVDPAEALWPFPATGFRVEVSDPEGRYLPVAFDADLPARGIVAHAAPWLASPQAMVLPLSPGSPPQALLEGIPLFSAPARPVPDPLAVVRAQVVLAGTSQPIPWCPLGVMIDGATRGIGLSDELGRIAALFPYPEPPRQSLTSPPPERNDFTWEVTLVAFGTSSPWSADVPAFADLADVFASFEMPRPIVDSGGSPPQPFALAYRQPLVARSGTLGADASFLLVS